MFQRFMREAMGGSQVDKSEQENQKRKTICTDAPPAARIDEVRTGAMVPMNPLTPLMAIHIHAVSARNATVGRQRLFGSHLLAFLCVPPR